MEEQFKNNVKQTLKEFNEQWAKVEEMLKNAFAQLAEENDGTYDLCDYDLMPLPYCDKNGYYQSGIPESVSVDGDNVKFDIEGTMVDFHDIPLGDLCDMMDALLG